MTSPSNKKRVVTDDDIQVLEAHIAYAKTQGDRAAGVVEEFDRATAEFAGVLADIEQSRDAIAATANAVPYASLATFPASTTAIKPAIALDTGKVYGPGGATWGMAIGEILTPARISLDYGVPASRYGMYPGDNPTVTSTALQAAIDDLAGGPDAILLMAPGADYRLNREFFIPANIKIVGLGTTFSFSGVTRFSFLIHGAPIVRGNIAGAGLTNQLLDPAYEDVQPISGVALQGITIKSESGARGGLDVMFYFADDSGVRDFQVRDTYGTGVSFRNSVRPWFDRLAIQNFSTYALFVYQCHGGRFKNYVARNGGLALDFKQRHKFHATADHILDGFLIEDMIGFPAYGQNGYNPMWLSGARAFRELLPNPDVSAAGKANRNFDGCEVVRGAQFLNGMLRVTPNAPAGVYAPVVYTGAFADRWRFSQIDVEAGGRAAQGAMFNIGANGDIAEAQAAGTGIFGGDHVLEDIRVRNAQYNDSAALIQYGVPLAVRRFQVRDSTVRRVLYQAPVSALPKGTVERVEWRNNDIDINILLGVLNEAGVAPQPQTKLFVTGGNRLRVKPVDSGSATICNPLSIQATVVQGGEGDTVEIVANPASVNYATAYGAVVKSTDGEWGRTEFTISAPVTALGVLVDPPAANTLAVNPVKLNLSNTPTGAKIAMQTTQAVRRVADNTLTGAWATTLSDTSARNGVITSRRILYGTAPPTTGAHNYGDFMWNTASDLGKPNVWRCASTGSPGTWVAVGQIGYRSGSGGPTVSANFPGETFYDTSRPAWFIATRTGSATPADDWVALTQTRTVKSTVDVPLIAAGASAAPLNFAVQGAVVGDHAIAVPELGLEAGLNHVAVVSAAGIVSVTITNNTAAAIDPASRVWRVATRAM